MLRKHQQYLTSRFNIKCSSFYNIFNFLVSGFPLHNAPGSTIVWFSLRYSRPPQLPRTLGWTFDASKYCTSLTSSVEDPDLFLKFCTVCFRAMFRFQPLSTLCSSIRCILVASSSTCCHLVSPCIITSPRVFCRVWAFSSDPVRLRWILWRGITRWQREVAFVVICWTRITLWPVRHCLLELIKKVLSNFLIKFWLSVPW